MTQPVRTAEPHALGEARGIRGEAASDSDGKRPPAPSARQQDLNLWIKAFLNGAPFNNIVLDTTQTATDTIDYVASDREGPHVHLHPHRDH